MATNGIAADISGETDAPVATRGEQPVGYLLQSPEVQAALAEVIKAAPDLINAHLASSQGTTRRTMSWLLVWIGVIIIVIVTSVTALTFAGKLSSDALGITLGTLVGAAFIFVRDFFPRGN